jgi:hypothetical protein
MLLASAYFLVCLFLQEGDGSRDEEEEFDAQGRVEATQGQGAEGAEAAL